MSSSPTNEEGAATETTTTSSSSSLSLLMETLSQMLWPTLPSEQSEDINNSLNETINMLMPPVFWLIVTLIILVAINIYRKVLQRNNELIDENSTSEQNEQAISSSESTFHSTTSKTTACQPANEQTIKKRLIRQTETEISGNELCSTLAQGKNKQSVEWIDQVLDWLNRSTTTSQQHQHNPFVQDVQNSWIHSLNAKSKQLVIENGIYVEFVSLEPSTVRPKLSQVQVAEEINDNIITTLKATCDRLVIHVRVAPDSKADANRSAIYEVILERFSSLLKVVCISNESLFVIRMLERPETKAQIDGPLLGSKNKFMPDVIINAVLNILTSTIYDINVGKYRDFPKIDSNQIATKQNGLLPSANVSGKMERKLLLKIVGANDLLAMDQSHKLAPELYCTVEIDEPFQSARTSMVRDNLQQPTWDQHFMFNLNERSNEILFELYDGSQQRSPTSGSGHDTILANAIVNISELYSSPSQVQNLRLQSATSKDDFGQLVVEFLLMEHGASSANNTNINNNLHDNMIASNVTNNTNNQPQQDYFSYKSRPALIRYSSSSSSINSNSIDLQLYDYNDHQTISLYDERTVDHSTTTKSSSFMNSLYDEQILANNSYEWMLIQTKQIINQLIIDDDDQHKAPKSGNARHQLDDEADNYSRAQLLQQQRSLDNNEHINQTLNDGTTTSNKPSPDIWPKHATLDKRLSDSGPRSSSSKSLIRNIKKRFSFNKRSKSMERQINKRPSVGSNHESEPELMLERARSVPGSREASLMKEIIPNNQIVNNTPSGTGPGTGSSQRSKQESFGNLSQASGRTFMHEDSILILESSEKGGIVKHYVIPNSMAAGNKLKKLKGNKLHLYKDHLFMAKHLPASKLCQICGKKFPFRMGKQAYQCRDCGLHCHKACHVLVETKCFNSTIASLNWETLDGNDDVSAINMPDDNSRPSPFINNNNNFTTIPELKITDESNLSSNNNMLDEYNIAYNSQASKSPYH